MINNKNTVWLTEFDGENYLIPDYVTDNWAATNSDKIRTGLVVDVETTGVSHQFDQIIEIGMILFKFNRENGDLIEIVDSYSSFNELKENAEPLSKFVTQLTGLTEEIIAGHKIDWNTVNSLFEQTDIIIAHNAIFDRPFIDQQSLLSKSKIWGCSMSQIDWMAKGFRTKGLELLCQRHGFFVSSHRALADAQGTLKLISSTDTTTGKTYLAELLSTVKIPQIQIEAVNAPFEAKELLKRRLYRWNPERRVWTKLITEIELDTENEWLMEKVYAGFGENPATSYKLPLKDNFKLI